MSSRPRQSLRGQTLHVTRRTTGRHFFMAPSIPMMKVCRFACARGLEVSGQVPHAHVTMSNHNHSQNSDPNGRRSKYTETMHGIIGRYGNGLLDRSGHFWDNRRTSETVLLHDPDLRPYDREKEKGIVELLDDVLLEVAVERDLDIHQITALYIWMNPVKADLVDQIRHWPGFKIMPDDWGRTLSAPRPAAIEADYPDVACYSPKPPPGAWSEMSLEDAIADANALIALAEDRYRERRHRARRRVLGPRACRDQDPWRQPAEMRLPASQRRRTGAPPRFSGHPDHVQKANRAYYVFDRNHTVAGRKFRNGDRDVVFPAGSIGMQRIAGVTCRARPLADENPMP